MSEVHLCYHWHFAASPSNNDSTFQHSRWASLISGENIPGLEHGHAYSSLWHLLLKKLPAGWSCKSDPEARRACVDYCNICQPCLSLIIEQYMKKTKQKKNPSLFLEREGPNFHNWKIPSVMNLLPLKFFSHSLFIYLFIYFNSETLSNISTMSAGCVVTGLVCMACVHCVFTYWGGGGNGP